MKTFEREQVRCVPVVPRTGSREEIEETWAVRPVTVARQIREERSSEALLAANRAFESPCRARLGNFLIRLGMRLGGRA